MKKDIKKLQVTGKAVEKLSLQKLPPYNLEAEMSVLGAIFLDNQSIFKALEIMSSADFYRPHHTIIFDMMLKLINDHQVVDLLTVRDALDQQGKLDYIGGPAYLAEISDSERSVPTASNIESHARIVAEKALARRLLNTSLTLAYECYDDRRNPDELLEAFTHQTFAIAECRQHKGYVGMPPVMDEVFTYLDLVAANPGHILGLPTGWIDLDWMTTGFAPADLVTIAAWPGEGKTAMALGIAEYLCLTRKMPVVYFSLEMSRLQLGLRMACMLTRLNLRAVRLGQISKDDWDRLSQARNLLENIPLYIDDTAEIAMLELRAKARRLRLEHHIEAVIVDHLGLIKASEPMENRTQSVAYIARQLKMLAKELNIPVIALCQLRKKSADNKEGRPDLSDLKDSGAIVECSDIVLFPYRPEVHGIEGTEGLAEIIIGKQRNGPTGIVAMTFLKECARFESSALNYRQPQGESTDDEKKVF
jgi:replicative DNA helicase